MQQRLSKVYSLIDGLICPVGLTASAGLRYWQERTIGLIVLVAVSFGAIVYIPSVVLSIWEEHYFIALVDTLLLAGGIALLVYRPLPYALRAVVVFGFTYVIGILLFWVLGPFGAGPVWIFAFPVLVSVLKGRRWAIIALTLNAVFLVCVGVYIYVAVNSELVNPLGKWIVVSMNFLLLDAIAVLGVGEVVRGLESSLLEEQHARAQLAEKHTALHQAHEHLARETSERTKAGQALHLSEERFKRAFETIPDAVFIYDENFEVCFSNEAARDFADHLLDAPGKCVEATVGPPGVDQVYRDLIQEAFTSKKVCRAETTFELQDLGLRNFRIICVPLASEEGENRELLCLCHDFTERMSLEKRLRQAQKLEAIGTLAGGIAHDFNNILGVILGYANLAAEDLPSDSEVYEFLRAILKSGERATELAGRILAFSRQEDRVVGPFEMQRVVEEVLDLLEGTLPSTIAIDAQLEAECGVVMGDAGQMHQVVMNLCTNAYHAMREKGGVLTVTLSAAGREAAPELCLLVKDTGYGMDAHTLERLFDPYFTTKAPGEGTGLGLATVHGIIKSHGGRIEVESQLGRGATFRVYLPLSREEEGHEAAPALATDLPRGAEHVLLVDDEEALAETGRKILSRLGYRVSVYANGLEALEAFRENPNAVDIIVTDQTMPCMTGLDLAQEARLLRPDLGVVLCTGYSELVTEAGLREVGIQACLMKPVSPRDLAKTLRRILDQAPSRV